MMRSERSKASRIVLQVLAVLLCLIGMAWGQKAAKLMVPDKTCSCS